MSNAARARTRRRWRLAAAWAAVLLAVPLWLPLFTLALVAAFDPRWRHLAARTVHPRQLVRLWWAIAGRHPHAARLGYGPPAHATPLPARPSSTFIAGARVKLAARDGLRCQECGRQLDPQARGEARKLVFPHVHHLRSWHANRFAWWVNALWNLCLLCPPCNLRIGPGSTPTLDHLADRLLAAEVTAGRVTVTA